MNMVQEKSILFVKENKMLVKTLIQSESKKLDYILVLF
jgi:hypothetical protein